MQLRFGSGLGPASRSAPLLLLPICLWRVGGGKPSRVKELVQERLDWLKPPQCAGEAGGHFLWLEWTQGFGRPGTVYIGCPLCPMKSFRILSSQVFGKYTYFAACGLTLKVSRGLKQSSVSLLNSLQNLLPSLWSALLILFHSYIFCSG